MMKSYVPPPLFGQNLQNVLSVLFQFGLAHTIDAGQGVHVGRPRTGDLAQRLVLEDHVRGHALLPGLPGPPTPAAARTAWRPRGTGPRPRWPAWVYGPSGPAPVPAGT